MEDSQSGKQMRLCLLWPAVYITVLLGFSTEKLQYNIVLSYMIYFPFFAYALGSPVVACTLLDEFSDFSSDCTPASDGS